MATTAETLDMLDLHWQESGTSLLDVLDRLGQQSHGLPPFPRELVDAAPQTGEDPEPVTEPGRHSRQHRESDSRQHQRGGAESDKPL